jgi:hypothetical protein
VANLLLWPQPPSDDPLGEAEWPRIRRDFWEVIGSGQAGLVLLVVGVLVAAAATWIAQDNHLDVLATAEWAVGLGLGIPFLFAVMVFFRVAFRVPKAQRDAARVAYQIQREAAEANLVIDLVDGVVVGRWNDAMALVQVQAVIRNTGTTVAPIRDWQGTLIVGDVPHVLRHTVGARRLRSGDEDAGAEPLPRLDRVGPLPPGLIAGVVQFVIPEMSMETFLEVRKTDAPMSLTVEAYGPVQRWVGVFDFRADYAQITKQVDAQPPLQRLRTLSQEGHRLREELPKPATPTQMARLEPRIDDWAARVREFLTLQRPEFLGQLDVVPTYIPASLDPREPLLGSDVGTYLHGVLAVVDGAITAG